MFLPTIYTSFLLAAFSWASFLPTNIQLPTFSWPSSTQPHIISPQPPEFAFPTSSPTQKVIVTPTPTQKPTPTPTRTLVRTTTPKPMTTIIITTKPTATPKPTLKPTSTLTIKPTATPTPRPTATPILKPTATSTPATSVSLDSKQHYILDQINDYRKANGLSEVKADNYTCDFAKTRSEEIVNGFNHDGFTSRANSHTLPYPSYHNVTENLAMTSDYTQVVTMWKNSAGHAENMRSDTPYVCVAYTGNYYAYEGWKP